MNYFFELLDSYHKRGCCISRIDEQGVPLAQDPRLPKLQALIKTPPAGTQVFASKKYNGAFSVNDPRVSRVFTVDADGMFVGGSEKFNKGVLTTLFGPLENEKADEVEPKKDQLDLTSNSLNAPSIDPIKAREDTLKQIEYQTINQNVDDVLAQMAQDDEASCRAKVRFDSLIDDLRPGDKFKPSLERVSSSTGVRNLPRNLANNLSKKFQEYYKTQKDSCKFIDEVLKLVTDPKQKEALMAAYFNGSLEQARINMLGRSQNSIANSIEFSHDPKIGETLKKLLDGSCEPNQVCVPDEEVSEEDKVALRESFLTFMELASKDKLSSDEKLVLTSLLRLTDDRRIALAGITQMDSIIIPDRGRSFLDMIRFIERKHNVKFDTLNLIDRIHQEGSENSAIGTLFEHWKKIACLALTAGKNPADAKKYEKLIKTYMEKVGNACKTMQAIDKRIRAAGKDIAGIPLHSHEDLLEVKHDTFDCNELRGINKLLTARVMSSFKKIGIPDAVIQTGTKVGKGFRSDVMLGYNSEKDALKAAKKSGLDPKAVKKMTVEQFLNMNLEFKNMVEEAGLTQAGSQYDLAKEIYVIPEGLKTSSGKGTNGVNAGSSNLASVAEDIVLAGSGGDSPWVSNVAKDLGIRNYRVVSRKAAEIFEKDFASIESSIDSALPRVDINGTLENTANMTASQIMDAIRGSSTKGENTKKDEAFAIADKFAKEAKKKNPNPKIMDRYKTRLKEVLKRRVLEDKLTQFLDSENIEDRQAGALILGLVGGVNSPQSMHYADLMSDKQYIGDHNKLAVGPLKALIEGTEGYQYGITRAGASFAVSITTAGGSNFSIRFSGTGAGSTAGVCSVSKSIFDELGFTSLNEKMFSSVDKALITEMVKMLKSQLIHLNRIFS